MTGTTKPSGRSSLLALLPKPSVLSLLSSDQLRGVTRSVCFEDINCRGSIHERADRASV
jgi:hypothetical protein